MSAPDDKVAATSKRERIHAALLTLKPDGSDFATDDKSAVVDAITARFVENLEVKKPCRTCGTERHDYSYWKVTAGGRLFMEACAALTNAGDAA